MSRGTLRAAVAAIALVSGMVAPTEALATHEKLLTLAARVCPSFASITANTARNNIMESLEDLGANSPYKPVGSIPKVMDPDVEAAVQPDCEPLANWKFTLGKDYKTRAVSGSFGSLSIVTDPIFRSATSLASVPLLTDLSADTGRTIQGAVTIKLIDDEVAQADKSDLWVQGGTQTAPVADPDTYAFGALRCATDNVNGDNVEYVAYPTGKNHVFCFAYYVSPAPTAGTIKIVKTVSPDTVPAQDFPFQGNVSYAEGGAFTINASGKKDGSASFIRAGGRTWSFKEIVPPGFVLTGLTCSSKNGTSTSTITAPAASVALAAGDTVTCTFANGPAPPEPPPGGLIVRKITDGGLGTFPFHVTGKAEARLNATTKEEGVATEAQPEGSPKFPPGDYRIEEELPSTAKGDWKLSNVFCNDSEVEIVDDTAVHFKVPAKGGVCTFTNTFTPAGSITLRKSTVGATGTFVFAVRPQSGDVTELIQRVTTTSEHAADSELATGDSTDHLPLGAYTIQETTASSEGDDGLWRVDSVICDGVPVPSFEGAIRLELTRANPDRDCTWTNQLIKSPHPPEPPDPEPPTPPTPTPPPTPVPGPPVSIGGVAGASAVSPPAELRITKVVKPRRITLGHSARWKVTVRNLGPVDARAVTLVERSRVGRAALKLRPSQGRCRGKPPRFCVIGRLRPGQRETVSVTARPKRLGRIRNVVVVNSITRQRTSRGKRASVTAVVVPAAAPRFTG
jgi:Domain of unknown function DUF11